MLKLNTKRILIPYDFSSTANRALKHAAAIAKSCNGELLLFYARRNTLGLSLTHSVAELRELVKESESYSTMMESTAERTRKKYDIPVKVHVGVGRTVHQIMRVARKRNAGLIVMGTQGSDSVSNLLSGSNSNKVISRSDVPVLTVRSEKKEEGYTKILLPIDLSEHTRQKVIIAIQLAKTFGASIHLLGISALSQAHDENKLQAIIRQVKKRIEEEEIAVDLEFIHTNEILTRTLVCAKRVQADLIIAMTDQSAGTNGLFSHSYDEGLVDRSVIPVLSIPPEIHEENIAPASIGGLW